MQREPVKELFRAKALENVEQWFESKIIQKGEGSLVSLNELRGALDEKVSEVKEAIKKGDRPGLYVELLDLTAGCIFALACLEAETL